jgi:hypothetical protein
MLTAPLRDCLWDAIGERVSSNPFALDPARAEFGWEAVDATGWAAARLTDAVGEAMRHSFDLAIEIPLWADPFNISDRGHVYRDLIEHELAPH